MKLINSILLSIIALLPLAAHTAEKRVTIFTSEGYEKELVIDVPSQLMGQEEHYTKAYILNYMRWWNMGVGTTKRNARKYQFDLTHFNENTPPRQISRQAEAAADRHFSKDDFWAKVVAEGDRFINDINHKSDSSETGMVSLSIKPTGGGGGKKILKNQ
ncbi:hypothetical protein, partial [Cephaloticoccus primus]|uniref:hypothetical protein n=1 Tax=Cephaloticoccus primus TaxID=1548207 RepID=UPI0012E7B0D5